ncbi:MAG: hypothetical protein M1826_004888 [Phylliscum demangeonii]|nr:MAG: hypothetical protein M1826_004888 [Phylliscum demangeonii]
MCTYTWTSYTCGHTRKRGEPCRAKRHPMMQQLFGLRCERLVLEKSSQHWCRRCAVGRSAPLTWDQPAYNTRTRPCTQPRTLPLTHPRGRTGHLVDRLPRAVTGRRPTPRMVNRANRPVQHWSEGLEQRGLMPPRPRNDEATSSPLPAVNEHPPRPSSSFYEAEDEDEDDEDDKDNKDDEDDKKWNGYLTEAELDDPNYDWGYSKVF